MTEKPIDISTKLGALNLPNPVLVASGTFGYGNEYKKLININKLGGMISKTITLKPRSG
ncbi:MAG: dihydroorotate dehydrogenase, partial [bacterium]